MDSIGSVDRRRHQSHYMEQQQPNHHHRDSHPKNRVVKMFNKVQVVYYLTRNGHLEHPHYIEVTHLATQPLRLRDVIERLALLRGKAMPCQYSWSCKRSYKNGYVWNDLTENDAIYASEGSEYILKGSELMQDRDFSEIKLEEFENKGRKQIKTTSTAKSDTIALTRNKPHQRHSFQQVATNQIGLQDDHNGYGDDYESEQEEEKRVSCNSSNANYTKPNANDTQVMMQMEQEESYSLPSTSSTISDKPPQAEKPPVLTQKDPVKRATVSDSKRFEEGTVIEEDGDPHSTALIRNPVLLQLIACGGVKAKATVPKGGNKNNFNFNMRNAFIPCLKQQLSTRGLKVRTNPVNQGAWVQPTCGCKVEKSEVQLDDNKDVDDQDMIMLRYMSENPRFGNLQSQEKEYFSGTIVETMAHHTTPSFGSESGLGQAQGPTFAKSSSYNELRSAKAGLKVAAAQALEEDESEEVKAEGMIKLCLPRKKSCTPSSNKSNKL